MTEQHGVAEVRLRPAGDDDREQVLALNARNVALLSPMDEERFERLRGWAHRFDVVEQAGRFAGFVVTFAPGAPYDSENYRWFAARHGEDFLYLDRIVLHEDVRRQGLGGRVYDEVEAEAAAYGRLALEVNADPPNVPSLRFHAARGYVEVGRLGEPGHVLAMLEKHLGGGNLPGSAE